MLKEFKEFALRGNLVDMAIAFVMGGAFGKIVTAFVDGMVMPLVGLLTSGKDFSKLVWEIKAGAKEVLDEAGNVTQEALEPVVVKYGAFITVLIDFTIVAFVMFLVVKAINRMKKKQEEAPAAPPAPSKEEVLLGEIRDLLKNR
jgi:large conductance mechanosensitive channel